MRLVRSLLKAVVVLAFAALALGGAAALGSTLFEQPPRDAAEFAQRIEAGSTRHEPEGTPLTTAEKRYVRRVNSLCARFDARTDALAERGRTALLNGFLRERQLLVARFRELAAPRRYTEAAQRLLALEAELQPALQEAVDAMKAGASEPPLALRRRIERLEAAFEVVERNLGALKCTDEWADRH